MQYVNDDMDELFRQAGENYPLDTNSADWNKVLAALDNQNETQIISEKKRSKNGRFLWLLLLLPLGLICNQLYSPGDLKDNGVANSDLEKEGTLTKNSNIQQKNSETKIVQSTKTNAPSKNTASPNNITENKNQAGDHLLPSQNFYSSKNRAARSSSQKYSRSKNTSSPDQINESAASIDNSISEESLSGRAYVPSIANRELLHEPSEIVAKRALNPSINPSIQETKSTITVARRKKFYAGLIGGMDATTIKFQKIEDIGFNYGLLLGYQFNKKWSLETGAYLERKYYYSDGKYFNTSKIYLPPNSRIDDLSGNCKMIEVPLSARYNFAVNKQSSWFGVVGLSSYFLLQENYTYNYYYGTIGPVPHSKEYNKSSTHLFSNIGISGGYTHRLGNVATIRLEPYLKLPLNGMGVGSLPLFSTGLQIGLTRKF